MPVSEAASAAGAPFQPARPVELFITACLGIAVFPHDGESLDSLLQHANAALIAGQAAGQRQVRLLLLPSLSERLRERMSRESGLHRALERNEFFIEYQPKQLARNVDRLSAVWRPCCAGGPPPAGGISGRVHTDSGRDRHDCRGRALGLGNRLQTAGGLADDAYAVPLQLSVNISAVQFHNGDLPEIVASVIDRHRHCPGTALSGVDRKHRDGGH